MRETIWLEEGDSVSVVRLKLEEARTRRVTLVVPPGSALEQSQVSLALVRRHAEALALDLVVATGDGETARLARLAGLRTASTGQAAKRPRGRRLAARARGLPALRAMVPEAVARAVPMRLSSVRLGRREQFLALTGVTAVLVLGFLIVVMLAVPGATVWLDPAGEGAAAEAAMAASTELQQVDYERRRVPARQVQTEVVAEESAQTTGKTTQPDRHATGEVVFANKTMQEVTVPKGTVVRTGHGVPVSFYTLLDTRVPGSFGATGRAPIMAFEPGPGGNVEALTIRVVEGEPSYQVDVLNDKATQGGSDKRVSVVSPQDQEGLRASLMLRLQQEAYNKLVGQLSRDDWIPPDSLDVEVVEETFDKKVYEEAQMLRLQMKVRVTGIAVLGEGTQALMARLLEAQAGKSLVVNQATLQVRQPDGSAAVQGREVQFRATASALLVPAIDLQAVSRRIAGRSPQDASRWLATEYAKLGLRQPPRIRLQPSWWPWLPWLPSRIHVQLSGGL